VSAPGPREPTFQEMLERYQRQQLEVEQALVGFQCPDPSGVQAPCAGVKHLNRPHIRVGTSGFAECPVFAQMECAPYRQLLEIQERHARAQWISAGREAGIPLRLMDACFKRGTATPALEAARTYLAEAASRGRALALLGRSGTGKSYAAAATIRAWSESQTSAGLFVPCDVLVNELLDWDTHAAVLDRTKRAPFLVLDDLGRGYMKRGGLGLESLEEILAHRHDEMLPTLVTSNWSVTELKKNLNARIIDRFRDWATIVALSGQSLRRG
jgi:DNA replication protein DnaC